MVITGSSDDVFDDQDLSESMDLYINDLFGTSGTSGGGINDDDDVINDMGVGNNNNNSNDGGLEMDGAEGAVMRELMWLLVVVMLHKQH